ncbi:DUF2393 family protein [Campylobacter sp. TTU-622]|uniref:DUF2393 family protein n=1 Tax=unclassified Campylobacter TaxID=2593542 RepID=UPI001904C0A2|nr:MULTISPECIES: DUF2393 family protein [unclassified Campylobacter]MBK1971781.1 DUF2393 family protein [Campylobacter sp. TTU_617]MBK1973434.1 DUF2393 family protein [Campylobacter sp. TTU-622]
MQNLRENLLFYINHFYLVDYMLILLIFFLFICVLLLCFFLRHRPITALIIIAFNIVVCFFLYIYGYRFIDFEVRNRKTNIIQELKIQSSNSLVIDFDISNNAKTNFKICKITAKIYRIGDKNNLILYYKNQFIPYRIKSMEIKDLKKNTTQTQRITFENFIDENHTIKLDSKCF